jgi:hypothetical protein
MSRLYKEEQIDTPLLRKFKRLFTPAEREELYEYVKFGQTVLGGYILMLVASLLVLLSALMSIHP